MNYRDLMTMNAVEASQKSGYSVPTIIKYLNNGGLKGINIGDGDKRPRWCITEVDPQDFIERMNERPNKKAPLRMPNGYFEEQELLYGDQVEEAVNDVREVVTIIKEVSNNEDAEKLAWTKAQLKKASGIALELAVLLEDLSK